MHLRYGWKLTDTPGQCACWSPFIPDHAMICRHGGLTFVRHNEIRDLTVDWIDKVCYDVAVEPPLQWLSGETIVPATANAETGRMRFMQISMQGDFEDDDRVHAFFDVRVFHPNAPSYRNSAIPAIYRRHEQEKERIW